MIEESDEEMLEGVLQKCDLSKGFVLLLSSPGGSGFSCGTCHKRLSLK